MDVLLLSSNNHSLAEINRQPLTGVLSFSQAIGLEAFFGLFKWCNLFLIMTKERVRDSKLVLPGLKYGDAVTSTIAINSRNSAAPSAQESHSNLSIPLAPSLCGRTGILTNSIGYCHCLIQKMLSLLEKFKNLLRLSR